MRICITRLLFLSTHWRETKSCSFQRLDFYDQFKILYKGLSGEDFIPPDVRTEKIEWEETLRILWNYKSVHILLLHLDNPWSNDYRIDSYYELTSFFDSLPRILKHLTRDEQFQLILEVNSYAQFRNTATPFRKLLKS